MKNVYPLLFLGLLTIGLSSSLHAQHAFDTKKKKNTQVNVSSLRAVKINGSSSKSMRRNGVVSGQAVQRSMIFPSLTQQRQQRVFYSNTTGLPSFITSTHPISNARTVVKKDIHTATRDYLVELKSVLQMDKPDSDFSIHKITTDKNNKTHVRLNQRYKEIPVYGSEVIVHLNTFGEGEAFNGHYHKITENIETRPAITEQFAVDRVKSHLSKGTALRPLSAFEEKLVQHAQPNATLCIYQDKGLVNTYVLAYHIVYCPTVQERWEYFVDASTGSVLHRFQSTCSADGPRTATGLDLNGVSRTVNTYQAGTTYFMVDVSRPMYSAAASALPDEPVGGILTIDMNNTFGDNQVIQHVTSSNNVWGTTNQTKALSAHFNAGVAYEYFRTNHSRNSIDGENGTIISIINVPDEDGQPLDNAFWNGKAMFYGNGDIGFKPLAGAMDVAGHEMTHGVVQSTANLEYQGESGAINESMADIFGSMMDPADWLIGEDVVKAAAFPSGALRSLSDPHNGGTSFSSPGYQPKHKNEAYTGTQDNGGVHINSGIPNHAFYTYAEAITRDKAADVFYKALKDYLTKSSQFIDLRLAVVKAAGDLFGTSSNEVTQAGLAFDFVGIINGQGGDYTETLPGNPGTEFLLVYNTDETDFNTLYRTSIDGSSATPLTTTDFISRPSITDKGDVAVFVAADNTIHVITTAPGKTPVEKILQEEQIWSNVVVSKGGTKIAAVTTDQEPKIHVYDFESEQWGTFELYNPTYSEGVNSAGPVYADALEWDYTGEYLVYDCFNRIDNASGADIEYWDVNFIHVWDGDAKEFADGSIEKLFSSLPDGVSIGNPSFAKNSPYIIAFDYVEEGTEDFYAVLGCNIETNEVNVITENNTLGWPSFNKNDSRIAFTALDNNSEYKISYILLNSDKISSNGSIVNLFTSVKWPVYFATGEREIGEEVITSVLDETQAKVSVSCYPNPFSNEISLVLKEPWMAGSRIEVINSMGQRVYEYIAESSGAEPLPLNLENLKAGYYIMRVSNAEKTGSCKIRKSP
jgi:bacillolysin